MIKEMMMLRLMLDGKFLGEAVDVGERVGVPQVPLSQERLRQSVCLLQAYPLGLHTTPSR